MSDQRSEMVGRCPQLVRRVMQHDPALLSGMTLLVVTLSACRVDGDRIDSLRFRGMFPVGCLNAVDPQVDAWARRNLTALLTELDEAGLAAVREPQREAYRLIAFGIPYHSAIRLERQGSEWAVAVKQLRSLKDGPEVVERVRRATRVLTLVDGQSFEDALVKSGFWTIEFPDPPVLGPDTVCLGDGCSGATCALEGVNRDRYRIFWRSWGTGKSVDPAYRDLCVLIGELASSDSLEIRLGVRVSSREDS